MAGGTTGLGEGNVLCSDKDAGPELELTRLGLAVYDELDARLGEEARVRRKGALIVHPDAETWAAEPERVARLRAAGVEARLLDAEDVREREPWLTGPLHGASCVRSDLQVDPRAIARALAREAEAAGARVLSGCAVEAIEAPGGRVDRGPDRRGDALRGRRRARRGAVERRPRRWRGAAAAARAAQGPARAARAARRPSPACCATRWSTAATSRSVASADAALQVTTVLETDWEGRVLVGSSRERRGFDLGVDDGVSAALLERAARLAPALCELEVDAAWAGLRPWLPDHLPAIGRSRTVDGLWVATGHEGAGVALGPVTGRVLAQAYCGEPPALDLAPFDPDRFAPA